MFKGLNQNRNANLELLKKQLHGKVFKESQSTDLTKEVHVSPADLIYCFNVFTSQVL